MYSSSSLAADESCAESVKMRAIMNEMAVSSVTMVHSAASRLRLLDGSPQKDDGDDDAMVDLCGRGRDAQLSEAVDISPWYPARGPGIAEAWPAFC